MSLGIDLGATTTVAALGSAAVALEDGPILASAVTWARGRARAVGASADRALDEDPRAGVRGPLRLLESGSSIVELSDGPVPVVALLGALLERVREAAGDVESVTLATPPEWSPRGRHGRALRAAVALAGLPPAELVPAPAAAAAWLARDDDGDALALCDIGGSGCRVAIVKLGATPRLAASRELALGADLVEESVYVELLRMLGEHNDAAAERLEELMVEVGGDGLWRRCHAELARAARRAREELCGADEAIVHVGTPVEQDLVLRREQVRALAERDLGPIAGAMRELIAGTSAAPRRCVLMGGAAPTPGLAELLTAGLQIPVEIAEAPQLVTALGASAWGAAQGTSKAKGAAPRGGSMVLDVLAEGVLTAAASADGGAIVVRESAIERIDARGQVTAEAALRGGAVRAVYAGIDGVLVVAEELATVFGPMLDPLAARRQPLAGALADGVVWILTAGDPPRLVTYALARDVAALVQDEPLTPPAVSRRAPWGRRRGPEAPTVATALGTELTFAAAAGGAQVTGRAGVDGLNGPVTLATQPPWTFGFARVGPNVASLLMSTGARGPASLVAAGDVLWSSRDGVAALLATGGATWLAVTSASGWELLHVSDSGIERHDGGGGPALAAGADVGAAWLVVDEGRSLILAAAEGSVRRLALPEPLEPVGVAGERVLALRGTELVALAP